LSAVQINECEKHFKSRLDTVTVRDDLSKTERLTFLIDTGAEKSIVKDSSLNPGSNYEPTKGINVRGISNTLLKTERTMILGIFTPTQETTHTFHIMGDGFDCQYDGILDKTSGRIKEPLLITVTVQLLWE
jgi:hypothetical protein